jgi:HSP20 family molecular chaperone IbpA
MSSENPTSEIETREKQEVEREQTRPGIVFRPDVDIVEQAGEFLVTADLPGVDDQHVDVRLENGNLAIHADLAVEPEPGWQPIYDEYRVGSYYREFALSDQIDVNEIKASMKDGVLELHLPKAEKHQPRSIEVKAG